MDIKTQVKNICKSQGIALKDLASRLGITKAGLSTTLGQPYPQLQSLERIAGALGVDVVDLLPPKSDIRGYLERAGEVVKVSSTKDILAFLTEDELKDIIAHSQEVSE